MPSISYVACDAGDRWVTSLEAEALFSHALFSCARVTLGRLALTPPWSCPLPANYGKWTQTVVNADRFPPRESTFAVYFC